MRYNNRGYHWKHATNLRLRELARDSAYNYYPEMEYAEDDHDGTVDVCFGSQGATITLGLIDDEAVQLFGYGHCAILAWELSQLTGLPLAVFTAPATDGDEGWSGHVALFLGYDQFLDIHGVNSAAEIAREYRQLDGTYELMGEAAFKELIVDQDYLEDPKQYLLELEQLVLLDFVALMADEYKDAIASATTL